MSEESTTPDLVERVRGLYAAANRRDLDATVSVFAPDAVWEAMMVGASFEGVEGIVGFFEDWVGDFEEWGIETEEVLDLGNGVTFAVVIQNGRPLGSSGHVHLRFGSIAVWVNGVITRVKDYTDIDEARAAAERLAEERG